MVLIVKSFNKKTKSIKEYNYEDKYDHNKYYETYKMKHGERIECKNCHSLVLAINMNKHNKTKKCINFSE